jgi:hypothetical protein
MKDFLGTTYMEAEGEVRKTEGAHIRFVFFFFERTDFKAPGSNEEGT